MVKSYHGQTHYQIYTAGIFAKKCMRMSLVLIKSNMSLDKFQCVCGYASRNTRFGTNTILYEDGEIILGSMGMGYGNMD